MTKKIKKTDEEWREMLTEEQHYVTRQKGTEMMGTDEEIIDAFKMVRDQVDKYCQDFVEQHINIKPSDRSQRSDGC